MKIGEFVVTRHDTTDTAGNKTFLSGTLAKVTGIALVDAKDPTESAVRLAPLFAEEGIEFGPVYIRDILTCEKVIDSNTKRAYQILKRKNYEKDIKTCSRAMAFIFCFMIFGFVCIVLNTFSSFFRQLFSAAVLTILFTPIWILAVVALVRWLWLSRQCGLVRKNAIRCLLDMRTLRTSNPEVQWIPLDLSGCGTKISTEEIEMQALNAWVQAAKSDNSLSQYGLGVDGSEYSVYKVIAENTLENLNILQDFLQSNTKEETA